MYALVLVAILSCAVERPEACCADEDVVRYLPRSDSGDMLRPRIGVAMWGQSNEPGRKFIEQVTNQVQHDLLIQPFPAVNLYDIEYQNNNPLGDPLYDYVRALQPRPFALPTPNMGIELSMGHYLDGIASNTWDIIKFGVGSTDLANEWNPDGTYPSLPAGTPNLWNQGIQRLLTAQRLLNTRIAAIVWIQGEQDALDAGQSAAYAANLTNLIARTRVYFPGVPFIIIRLSTASPFAFSSVVRAAQELVAATVPSCYIVNTDDLALDQGIHYTADSCVTLGYRTGPFVVRGVGLLIAPTADFTVQKSALVVQFTDLSTVLNATASMRSWLWDFGDGTTSTLQNPTHTYAGNGAYTVTLTVTDSLNQSTSTTQVTTVATPTWSVDATSGRGVPASGAEFSQLIAAHQLTSHGVVDTGPSNLYLFQQAAGTIADVISGKTMSITGTPVYQRIISGWSRFGIGSNGTAASQNANVTTLTNINASSALVLAYLQFNTTATNRAQLAMGASAVNELEVAGGTNFARYRLGAVGVNGTHTLAGTGVHPFVLQYDNEDQFANVFSDIDQITTAYTVQSGTSLIATFNSTADAAASTEHLYIAVWRGAAARKTPTEIKRLLQALAFAVSFPS